MHYAVTNEHLTKIADAIRAKRGTNSPLVFPEEFISAIKSIPSGSGGGGGGNYQSKTGINPTEQSQTITPDSGFDALESVQINGISSTYVGSGVTKRTSSNLTASGATVTAPAGYYASAASKSVAAGTEGTPTATKGSVSNHSVSVTPSVTNTGGYISGGTKNGTPVTVSAGELVSGTLAIDGSGTKDVTNYASVSVPSGSATPPASISGTGATVTAGTNKLTLTKTVNNTPEVSEGYVKSGTAGNSSVSLTADVNTRGSSDLTASGATVTAPAGYYASSASKSVGSGSAKAPSSISGTGASVSTGTNTLTLTKSVSVTPEVSEGYVTGGTARNVSVSLTGAVTTQAAQTIHPSASDQSIGSGRYLTGAQTIKGVTHNLDASKILSGTTFKIGDSSDDDCVASVAGTLAFQTIYSGSSAPSSSLGVDGDIYIQT